METATAYIGKKARDGIDFARLKNTLSKEVKDLNILYKELGKLSYEIHISYNGDADNINKIDNICRQIKEQIKTIKRLENEIKNMKEVNGELEDINEDVLKDNMDKRYAMEPTIGVGGFALLKFCPNCQVGNSPETKKCIACGGKL